MKASIEQLKQEVWNNFDEQQLVSFATVEEDQPKVRTVTVIHINRKFFVATHTDDAKLKQIQKNPKTEFCLLLKKEKQNPGQIRAECKAKIVKDQNIRNEIYNKIDWMKNYFKKPTDPTYKLIELQPVAFEYKLPRQKAIKIRL